MSPTNFDQDLDIYADLDTPTGTERILPRLCDNASLDQLYDEAIFGGQINSLECEVKCLRDANQNLKLERDKLKCDLASKEKQVKILKNNISSLYKTAKIELDRRRDELAELRQEYDALLLKTKLAQANGSTISKSISEPRISSVNNQPLKAEAKNSVNIQKFVKENCDNKYAPRNIDSKRKQSPLADSQESNRITSKSIKYDHSPHHSKSSSLASSTPTKSSSFRLESPAYQPRKHHALIR